MMNLGVPLLLFLRPRRKKLKKIAAYDEKFKKVG